MQISRKSGLHHFLHTPVDARTVYISSWFLQARLLSGKEDMLPNLAVATGPDNPCGKYAYISASWRILLLQTRTNKLHIQWNRPWWTGFFCTGEPGFFLQLIWGIAWWLWPSSWILGCYLWWILPGLLILGLKWWTRQWLWCKGELRIEKELPCLCCFLFCFWEMLESFDEVMKWLWQILMFLCLVRLWLNLSMYMHVCDCGWWLVGLDLLLTIECIIEVMGALQQICL